MINCQTILNTTHSTLRYEVHINRGDGWVIAGWVSDKDNIDPDIFNIGDTDEVRVEDRGEGYAKT